MFSFKPKNRQKFAAPSLTKDEPLSPEDKEELAEDETGDDSAEFAAITKDMDPSKLQSFCSYLQGRIDNPEEEMDEMAGGEMGKIGADEAGEETSKNSTLNGQNV